MITSLLALVESGFSRAELPMLSSPVPGWYSIHLFVLAKALVSTTMLFGEGVNLVCECCG
jgi:hypothetical protein